VRNVTSVDTALARWAELKNRFWTALPRAAFERELSAAIASNAYRDTRAAFDWEKFCAFLTRAYNLTPPLEWSELKIHLADEYGITPTPRHHIWWAIRIATQCADPRAWLERERRHKRRRLDTILADIGHNVAKRELQSFMQFTPRRLSWVRGADGKDYPLERRRNPNFETAELP